MNRIGKEYWYPMRPVLRWPARLIGFSLLIFVATEALREGELDIARFCIPFLFVLLGFVSPERRKDALPTRFVILIAAIVAVAVAGLCWMVYSTF